MSAVTRCLERKGAVLRFAVPVDLTSCSSLHCDLQNADMEEKMQQDAVDTASKALSEYNIEKVRTLSTWSVCSFSASFLTALFPNDATGRGSVHQEGVRPPTQSNLVRGAIAADISPLERASCSAFSRKAWHGMQPVCHRRA